MPQVAIRDDVTAYPYLLFGGASHAPLPWSEAEMFYLGNIYRYLRFSPRGMQYVNGEVVKNALESWWWVSCGESTEGLCEDSMWGQFRENILFFPTGVVDVPDKLSDLSIMSGGSRALKASIESGACERQNVGRIVTVGDTRYEVSLCDVLHSRLVYFYDQIENRMYYREDHTTLLELVFISIFSVIFISAISQNLIEIFQKSTQKSVPTSVLTHMSHSFQLVIVLLTVLYMIIYFAAIAPGLILFTGDYALLVQLIIFILLESGVHLTLAFLESETLDDRGSYQKMPTRDFEIESDSGNGVVTFTQKILNMNPVSPKKEGYVSILTACLLLLSCRVHYSFDNPYLLFLVTIFGSRSFYKLFRVLSCSMEKIGTAERVLQVYDLYIFCSLLGNGVAKSSAEQFEANISIQIISFLSVVVGGILWTFQEATSS